MAMSRNAYLDNKLKETTDTALRARFSQEKEQLLMKYYQETGLCKVQGIKEKVLFYINESR